MRTVLAGVAGAILMFIWSSLAHVVLPLGEVGVNALPNEAATIGSISAAMGDKPGLYLFPDTRPGKPMAAKVQAGPTGFLVYHPHATMQMMPPQLGAEFATELVETLLAALLLSRAALSSFASRVGFVTVAGVIAGIATNVPYWNWYGFPLSYTIASMATIIVGFFVAGFALAWMVPEVGSQ